MFNLINFHFPSTDSSFIEHERSTMSGIGSERSKPWIYSSSNPTPSETAGVLDQDAPWKNFGTSMNAISFGFVATAILISMFLLMAIFEHIFRTSTTISSSPDAAQSSLQQPAGPFDKLACQPQRVPKVYTTDFSVVMPGQRCPTYIAKPAPLPCHREGTYFPPHEHNLVIP